MRPIIFCNIGWMNRYEGLTNKPDRIVGGGSFVDDNDTGHEVCNFLACSDGYVYGHVETSQDEIDRNIRIEAIGGTGSYVNGVDVIWTATDPEHRGRRIVGWYRDATLFRARQHFDGYPSKQHKQDNVSSYRIRAKAKDAVRLDLDRRSLAMGRGKGWMGHTPWWVPSADSSPEVRRFVSRTRKLIGRVADQSASASKQPTPTRNSAAAASDPYVRYVEAYEVSITPRHSSLQERFERFLRKNSATRIRQNVARVDLRYRDSEKGSVLVEIKPCDRSDVRFAIRTAIGQLFDYRQRDDENSSLLIVVEVRPTQEDIRLATSNGLGIAFPVNKAFDVVWPKLPKR